MSFSDLLMSGDKGEVLALPAAEMALVCHVVLHGSSPFLVSTFVATLHKWKRQLLSDIK